MHPADQHRVIASAADLSGVVALISISSAFLFAFIFLVSISATARPQKRCFPDCIAAGTQEAHVLSAGSGNGGRAFADATGFRAEFEGGKGHAPLARR